MDLTATRQTWEVPSFSRRECLYIVRQNRAGEWSCSCPHWQYRLAPIGGHCKHILAILGQEETPAWAATS
jgi:SWIM zinc finger